MGYPAITYTLSNGATSDANQINTNYTDIINGLSDGTKDLNISALTAGGTATFNGSVTLGNASADDLTINASVASNIVYKTNATYNIGSSTLAAASIYLGNGSYTMRILPGTLSSTWTLTLPATVPSITGQSLIFNTSGTAEFRYPDKFTATKTANYTATGDETIIPCDPTTGGASFTVALPAASTCAGKSLTIVKIDSGLTYTVTIDPDSAETINGASTYVLYTQYESVTIKCNGSTWYVVNKYNQTGWNAFTYLTAGGTAASPGNNLISAVTTAPSFGSGLTNTCYWKRVGDRALIKWQYRHTGAGSAGSGMYIFNLESGISINTSIITVNTGTSDAASFIDSNLGRLGGKYAANVIDGNAIAYSATQLKFDISYQSSAGTTDEAVWGSGFLNFGETTLAMMVNLDIPVANWNP